MEDAKRHYKIVIDDLSHPQVIDLIAEHRKGMLDITPVESVHALGTDELKKDGVTFWTIWDGDVLMGCGALKMLNENEAEVKSMRTKKDHLKKGVAKQMLGHILTFAKEKNLTKVYLETGSAKEFTPAHTLYKKFGFEMCGPFGHYQPDPNSYFMVLDIK